MRYNFYTELNVIFVHSNDLDMVIKVSNALNIQVKDKIVMENFSLHLKNARAKWIEKGQPRPKKAGAKHGNGFKVCQILNLFFRRAMLP